MNYCKDSRESNEPGKKMQITSSQNEMMMVNFFRTPYLLRRVLLAQLRGQLAQLLVRILDVRTALVLEGMVGRHRH